MSSNAADIKNLDPTDEYAAERGYSRLSSLFAQDPLVSMLTKPTQDDISSAVFSSHGLGDSTLTVTDADEIRACVLGVLAMSAVSAFGEKFAQHVADLTVIAVAPEGVSR